MTKVISIANEKGGVGKTVTAINLGIGLARQQKSVLLIDFDPQANMSMGLGVKKTNDLPNTISAAIAGLIEDKHIDPESMIISHPEGIDFIAANKDLAGYETRLVNEYGREGYLRTILEMIKGKYDYILLDCKPTFGLLNVNALSASDSVIIPTQPQYFSVAGLQSFFQTINGIRRKINPKLKIEGILITMMDTRPKFTKGIVKKLQTEYGSPIMFDVIIPSSIRVTESSAVGMSIFNYDPKNKVTEAYSQLAKEVTDRAE